MMQLLNIFQKKLVEEGKMGEKMQYLRQKKELSEISDKDNSTVDSINL